MHDGAFGFPRPQQGYRFDMIDGKEAAERLVEHPAFALRGMAQPQAAIRGDDNEANMKVIEPRPLRDETDNVATGEQLPVGDQDAGSG